MSKNALSELGEALEIPTETKTTKVVFKSKEEKFKALKAVGETLNKQFKETHTLVKMGDKIGYSVPCFSTGLPTLDFDVIGAGGIPIGRHIELFGPESSGKSTLAAHIAGMEQKRGNIVAYIDIEHAVDPNYFSKLGVNMSELVISQSSSAEKALETVEALVDSQAVSLIIVDSVAGLLPEAELSGEFGDSHMGLVARLMSAAMRKLTAKCSNNGVSILWINQIRSKIGVIYGSPEVTTGGVALKFYASLRLDVRRKEAIKEGNLQIGHEIRVKAVKNKVGSPFRETIIELIYEDGINCFKDTVQYAVNMGVINKAGSWYDFNGERIAQGLENVCGALKGSPELMAKIVAEIDKARKVC